MPDNYPICPKCGYQRNELDKPVHPALCPACGICYGKWQVPEKTAGTVEKKTVYQQQENEDAVMSRWETLKELFLTTPEQVVSIPFYGRVFAFTVSFFWGCSFMLAGIDWQSIGGSFLHNINLPFHEFEHVLFMPFGRFWHILGGSLFQVLLPLLLLLAFAIQQKDNFAASIMLWWSGQNFIDVSPYIADAQLRVLPLIRGMGEESHDWGNLLTMAGNLQYTHTFVNCSFIIGCILFLISYIWGGYLLLQQKKTLI
jgi:hypothetical protein